MNNASPLGSTLRPDFVPKSDYISPEFHSLELERLWPKVWQVACRVEEIPHVGDYISYEILGFRGLRPNPVHEVGVTNIHRVLREYLFSDPSG